VGGNNNTTAKTRKTTKAKSIKLHMDYKETDTQTGPRQKDNKEKKVSKLDRKKKQAKRKKQQNVSLPSPVQNARICFREGISFS